MSDRTVSVRIRAVASDYLSTMKQVGTSTRSAFDEVNKTAVKNKGAMNDLAGALGVVGTAATAGAGLAVKSFMDFDKAMSSVKATGADAAKNIDALRQAAIQAGADTAFSATEAANGVENLAKAGVSSADILGGGLKGALDLAAAGQISVADASETAATAMTQFNLTGADVPHIADLLAAGAGKAQGEVSDMAAALAQSGLVASQFGLSIEETTGTLAAFASAGLIGSDAGTSFKTMLLALANPAAQTKDAMDKLGIAAYDANGQFVGIANLAQQLHDKLGGVSQATRDQALAQIFGNDAIRAANVLYKDGAAGINTWIKKVDDAGYAAKTAATKMDNLVGDLEQLKGSFETALIGLGEGADGPLRGLVESLTGAVNGFNDLPGPAKSATLAIVGAGGLATLGVAGMLKLVTSAGEVRAALETLNISAARVGTALKFAGAASAILAVAYAGTKLSDSMSHIVGTPLADDVGAMSKALIDFGQSGKESGELVSAFGANFEGVTRKFRADGESFTEAGTRLANSNWFDKFEDIGFDTARKNFEAIDKSLTQIVASGHAKEAESAFDGLAAKFVAGGGSLKDFTKLMPGYTAALKESKKEAADAAREQLHLKGGTDQAAIALKTQADNAKTAADSLKSLLEQMKANRDQALGLANAELGYATALADANKSIKDNGHSHDLATEKGRANEGALLALAGAANQVTESEKFMKQSAGDQIQTLADQRAAFIHTATQMGYNKTEAAALATEYLKTPKEVNTKAKFDDESAKVAAYKAGLAGIPKVKSTAAPFNPAKQSVFDWLHDLRALPEKVPTSAPFHPDKGAQRDWLGRLKALPEQVPTRGKLNADFGPLASWKGALNNIPASRSTTVTARYITYRTTVIRQKIERLPGNVASGGLIDHDAPGGVAVRGMASGGYSGTVTGPGTGTSDTAGLFALSNGEFVMRDAARRKYGVALLDAMNNGVAAIPARQPQTFAAASIPTAPVAAAAATPGAGNSQYTFNMRRIDLNPRTFAQAQRIARLTDRVGRPT